MHFLTPGVLPDLKLEGASRGLSSPALTEDEGVIRLKDYILIIVRYDIKQHNIILQHIIIIHTLPNIVRATGLHLMVAGLWCELEVVVVEVVRHGCKVEVIVHSKGVGVSCPGRTPHGIVGVRADVHDNKLVFLVKNAGLSPVQRPRQGPVFWEPVGLIKSCQNLARKRLSKGEASI